LGLQRSPLLDEELDLVGHCRSVVDVDVSSHWLVFLILEDDRLDLVDSNPCIFPIVVGSTSQEAPECFVGQRK